MKKTTKWLLLAVTLVVIILGAFLLYNMLSDDYKPDNLSENIQSNSAQNSKYNPAPDFAVLDYNGNKVKLSDFKGKPVVINFWATWCYYCKEEMPDFNKAFKEYPDVQFMMIDAADGYRETVEKAKDYVEKQDFDFDVFFDTRMEAVNAYYINSFPTTYFIDKDGNLVTGVNGMINYETLLRGIDMIIQ